ncbi:hypothetical protein THAOC_13709 [Thalassiosira oceanica]|uniref:Uncharacterized protein n=1 Tax=Thalassiosira oceanica TaxID=159749 RepID=K0SJA0_THAOC|nr:hypothetical protein THAOC_13709 [Thalassiosira oceanica]|eukprot:EJK65430.1 hypothetical protein THAOC_13709 [Thalassiosira oceanica]
MMFCGACERLLPDDAFSVEQRGLRRSIRRCIACVAAGNQLVLMKRGTTRDDDICSVCQLPLPIEETEYRVPASDQGGSFSEGLKAKFSPYWIESAANVAVAVPPVAGLPGMSLGAQICPVTHPKKVAFAAGVPCSSWRMQEGRLRDCLLTAHNAGDSSRNDKAIDSLRKQELSSRLEDAECARHRPLESQVGPRLGEVESKRSVRQCARRACPVEKSWDRMWDGSNFRKSFLSLFARLVYGPVAGTLLIISSSNFLDTNFLDTGGNPHTHSPTTRKGTDGTPSRSRQAREPLAYGAAAPRLWTREETDEAGLSNTERTINKERSGTIG